MGLNGQQTADGLRLKLRYLREYLSFDSRLFLRASAVAGLALSWLLLMGGRRYKAFLLLSAVHRGNWSKTADRIVERLFRNELSGNHRQGTRSRVLRHHISAIQPSPGTDAFFHHPEKLIGKRLLVLKPPVEREKGIVLIDYSFTFPMVARFFDLERIADRYHIVIEPSWSGYCDLDVLCYAAYDFPVFVEAFEPRDAQVVRSVAANLIPVQTSTNWWVDHRIMRPLDGVPKDRDLVMIASWARFKRHARFFAALRRLQRRGHRLSVSLLGYGTPRQLADISREAEYYGVRDQVEFFEWLKPEEVNYQLNRAKVNVIWSRKEGVNRAIVEGMFAGVPCILREGFNYGYPYPYVNEHTGRFANEATLPEVVLDLLESHREYAPRDWVMSNMSCQRATEIVAATVRDEAVRRGEPWTTDPVVKVCYLNDMRYWDEADRNRFAPDYAFLKSTLRTST